MARTGRGLGTGSRLETGLRDRPRRGCRVHDRCGVTLNDHDLRAIHSRRDFRGGTFLVEGGQTYAAFDLEEGRTTLTCAV